jgi:hypothetical protein
MTAALWGSPSVPFRLARDRRQAGKAISLGWRRSENSQATSWQTAWQRLSIRPWSLSVDPKVASTSGGGSAKKASTSLKVAGWFAFNTRRY